MKALESFFGGLIDVPFCVKDIRLRYVAANAAMAHLCGVSDSTQIIGRRSVDFFCPEVSQRFEAFERQILATGWPLLNRFESTATSNGKSAWLLITRIPVRNDSGEIVGVGTSSRQFRCGNRMGPVYERVARVARKIEASYDEALKLPELAALAGVSISQLERDFVGIFGVTPNVVVNQIRINRALQLLETQKSIATIAYECGFSDQSAFNRRFKGSVGMNPRAYREVLGNDEAIRLEAARVDRRRPEPIEARPSLRMPVDAHAQSLPPGSNKARA